MTPRRRNPSSRRHPPHARTRSGGHAALIQDQPSPDRRSQSDSPRRSGEGPADTPELTCRAFAEALSAGLPDLAAACFARDGCLIAPDATSVHGRADICLVLIQLVALQTQVEIASTSVFEGAELALVRQRWKIAVQAPDDSRDVQLTDPTLVLRRIESEWKLAIAAPWGAAGRQIAMSTMGASG